LFLGSIYVFPLALAFTGRVRKYSLAIRLNAGFRNADIVLSSKAGVRQSQHAAHAANSATKHHSLPASAK